MYNFRPPGGMVRAPWRRRGNCTCPRFSAGHANATAALGFFTHWPNLAAAARLTLDRVGELDGRDYHTLGSAAEALSDRHPLAATLLYRRLIDSALERGAAKAYAFAAKNLAACAVLDSEIDWSATSWPPHAAYVRSLLTLHGRKWGFWSLVKP